MTAVTAVSDATESAPLRVEDLTVAYDARPVLRSVSFEMAARSMLAVVGPNGAGKSTLLKTMLGLLRPDYGRVEVFGDSVEACRSRIAYVPQTEAVDWDFPVTVREVVSMGRVGLKGWFSWVTRRDRRMADEALERVGMTAFANRHIRQLSGGQQRRVFIARALAQDAELMLMDEPFAGVDAVTERAIFNLLDDLSGEGRAVVVVNHDLSILHRFDAVLLLNQRVIAYGAPDVAVNDDSLRATYGGRLSLLDEADETLRQRIRNDIQHASRTATN